MRTRNETTHQLKKMEILKAAQRCFVDAGFHQTGMQDVCAAAAMSPGALYRYFPSKDSIIAALAEQERAENQKLMTQIDHAPNVLIGLLEIIDQMSAVFQDRALGRLTLDIGAEAARNPKVAKIYAEAEDEVRKALGLSLKRGQKAGHIRRDLDVQTAAHLLISIFDGLIGRGAFPLPVPRRNLTIALSELVRRFLTP